MKNLTPNQKKILEFIEGYQKKSGVPPTYETIGKKFGYAAKSSVQHHIEGLISKGYLTKERYLSNGITIHREGNLIPLLGKVAAGVPLDYKKHDERMEVPIGMLRGPGSYYALQVSGDSMIGEGILEGDFVIIREQSHADNGEIVVAELEDEATIKKLLKKKNQIELHSANPKYKPIIVQDTRQFKISGVFCGLIRYF